MQPVFEKLAPEYAALNARAVILPGREHVLAIVAEHLRADREVYDEVSAKTRVPTAALMALSEREMSGNLHCYLGNGQPLNRVTTIVPQHRGPFLQTFPENFIAGALDALHLDGLDKVADDPGGWSMERFAYESELWNGFGYRARGIPSPYVYGSTTVQRPGKFIRDHVYSNTTMDPQLGTLAIVEELIKQDSSLAFAGIVIKIDSPSIVPVMPHPVIGSTNIGWVQTSLNKLHIDGTPLLVDDNCGRGTRAAVRAFQQHHHLVVDGLPGPNTVASITDALAEAGLS